MQFVVHCFAVRVQPTQPTHRTEAPKSRECNEIPITRMSLDDFWHRNYTHERVKLKIKTAQVNPAGRQPITVTYNVITRCWVPGGELNHSKKKVKLLSERSLMQATKKPMSELHDVTIIKT